MASETSNDGRLAQQLRSAREEVMAMRGEMGGLAAELQTLLQLEAELAQAEANEAAGRAAKAAALGAVAGVLALFTTLFLFLAMMFAFDTILPIWAAALVTAGIAALMAAIIGFMGRREMIRFSPLPRRFIRTIQEDLQWARSQIRSSTK